MLKKKISYLSIIITFITFVPLFSFGQGSTVGTFLELTLSPENPEPLQTVTANLKSYVYDLDRSKITWSVNDIVQKTDLGLKQFTVQAKANGQKTAIKAVVETPADGTRQIETSFTPSVVDLVYEAFSYVPPFYKGKALNPNQGVVMVAAIPELVKNTGEKFLAQNIIYSWKKDGQVQQSVSGVGKNTFFYSGTVPIRDATIEVTASSFDGTLVASKEITITNNSPQIVFYEDNPIYGFMYNKAITGTVKMGGDEFGVLAVPYFFSVGYANSPDLQYDWGMNNKSVGNQNPRNIFTARLDKPSSGIADIALKISNAVRIFQFTDSGYSISFDKQ